MKFGNDLEGLVHISELAWQRINNPREMIKVDDPVRAQIINLDNGRISLSIKRLSRDPWEDVVKKYQVGQMVRGKVTKLMPFGAFVELDDDIHGLAHLGELSDKSIADPKEAVTEGEEYSFKIISIEPQNHRLGLSLKVSGSESSAPSSSPVKAEDKEAAAPAAEEKSESVPESGAAETK